MRLLPPAPRAGYARLSTALTSLSRVLAARLARSARLSVGLLLLAPAFAQETLPDTRLALEQPDRFNWEVFLELCRQAPPQLQTPVKLPDGGTTATNNALWETWATDPYTFPAEPDPARPPTWPGRLTTKLFVTAGAGTSGLERAARHGHSRAGLVLEVPGVGSIGAGATEEVRRNRATFDYIVQHHLYYTEGLARAWAERVDAAGYLRGEPISFPRDAIEVKADWARFKDNPELNQDNCHWNYDEHGELWGLIGLHIMTKALPNWTWATFEWVDNPTKSWKKLGAVGRSDWIGTHDRFGYAYPDANGNYGPFQAPIFADKFNLQPSGVPYPRGKISPALEALFREKGYTGDWRRQWDHYRLKGSQVDFVDTYGRPTLLGNSSTEAEVLFTDTGIQNSDLTRSSCITCHAAAAIQQHPQPGHLVDPRNIDFVVGPPNPRLYFHDVASVGPFDYSPYRFARTPNMAQRNGGYPVKNIPADFVWAFLNANSAGDRASAPKPAADAPPAPTK